ncbi:hypothetical protein ACHQM5_004067 [Ranunculus cassubicifolius]
MAFLFSNLSPSPLFQSTLNHQTKPILSPHVISLSSSSSYPVTKLETPPTQVQDKGLFQSVQDNNKQDKNDFYVNLGLAVRTLREDMPLLFSKDLNYNIYRDDITLIDPLNTFTGIEKYKLIFWALRFHGKILFREISLEVFRIWQPSENVILIRWNLKGVPRVPWEAKGQFQGTSRYKLDRKGKIYEHKVDNLAFNFPQSLRTPASVLDLVTACPTTPNPTFFWSPTNDASSSSWLMLYRAVRETLEKEECLVGEEGLVPCS